MNASRIEIIANSVSDGTISIEQVWQTYGNEIQNTRDVTTQEDVLALTELYLRYANYLANNGYLMESEPYYSESLLILNNGKEILSKDNYKVWAEIPLHSLAGLHAQLENFKEALPYFKDLKELFPRKDEYLQAYISCLRSYIAKYTTPLYIIIGFLFLMKIAEGYFLNIELIPEWLLDGGWFVWIVLIIVQFGLPWIMKIKTRK